MSQKISEMTKLPTLLGETKIPTGEPGPGGNYASDPAQILNLTRAAATLNAGVISLDFISREQRRFNVATAINENFEITFANTGSIEVFTLDLVITGTRVIQWPSTVRMQNNDSRWNNSNQQLTLVAGAYEMSVTYNGTIYKLKCSNPNV